MRKIFFIFTLFFISVNLFLLNRKDSRSEEKMSQRYESAVRKKTENEGARSKSRYEKKLEVLFSNAESYDELAQLFQRNYNKDQTATLDAWAQFQSPIFQENIDSFDYFISEVIGNKHPPLEAINQLQIIRGQKPEHYLQSARYIIRGFGGDEKIDDMIAFLNDENHLELAGLVAPVVGLHAGHNSPRELIEKIEQVKSPDIQGKLFEGVLRTWVMSDIDGAMEFLNSTEQTPLMESGLAEIAESTAGIDPSVAMSWAESIEGSSLRNQTIAEVASKWLYEEGEKEVVLYNEWKAGISDEDLLIELNELEEARERYREEIKRGDREE